MNNILIIGEPRCGKSSVSNYFIEKHREYEIIRGDAIIVAYEHMKSEKDGKVKFKVNKNSRREYAKYLSLITKELKNDLQGINKKILLDFSCIDLEDAVEMFGKECDIYCLGMADISLDELMYQIKKNDTQDDWSYGLEDFFLETICRNITEQSKENKEYCKKHNIEFFEMSGDRKQKILDVVKKIEEASVLDKNII